MTTTHTGVNYWRVAVIAAALVAVFLFGRSCGIGSVIKKTHSDTTIRKDSAIAIWVPVPIFVRYDSLAVKKILFTKYDTLWGRRDKEIPYLPEWVIDTLNDYYATRYYSDTQILKRGHAVVSSVVNRNRIILDSLQLFSTDTTITNTLTIYPPRKLVLSFVGSVMGHIKSPIQGVGAGFQLKLPHDNTYGFQVKKIWGMPLMGEVTLGFPIRIKPLLKMNKP